MFVSVQSLTLDAIQLTPFHLHNDFLLIKNKVKKKWNKKYEGRKREGERRKDMEKREE